MLFNGVIGTVASLINTALPLFFGGLAKELGKGAIASAPVGPMTLFMDSGIFKLGNFNLDQAAGVDPGAPVLVNFSSPEGEAHTNLSFGVPFGMAFDAETWIQQYNYGDVTVGTTEQPTPTSTGGPLQALWTYTTQAPLGVGEIIRAIVNPSLTLQYSLSVNDNVVIMTAIGAATLLGVTYLLTAKNNQNKEGTRSGNLRPRQTTKTAGGDVEFTLELPTGVSYAEGIYGFTLQLPIELKSTGFTSDERVKFETVPQEKIAAMKPLQAR